MAYNSPNDKQPVGLAIDLHEGEATPPPPAPLQYESLNAKQFVAINCEQSCLADILPDDMTLTEFSLLETEKILLLSSRNEEIATNLPFCIEMAKQHLQQCDNNLQTASLPCPISTRVSPSRNLSAPPISPRLSSLGSQTQSSESGSVPSNSSIGGLGNLNPQSARFNPLTRIFLRRTFSENTRRNRAPSCNLGASAGSALLKTAGLGGQVVARSPGLSLCSFGHELSNIVRLGGAAFGQSAPCLLFPRESDSNREFLSSNHHQGRLRSATTRRSSHASGGPLGTARNDSTASTATSPMESPKPFGQSGHFATGSLRYSGHRRWSVASLPGSSGYATEPGGVGSDGTSSIYTSNEGLPGSPSLNPSVSQLNALRQRHHTTSSQHPITLSLSNAADIKHMPPSQSSLLSPRVSGTSAFSSSDSNPVFDLQQQAQHASSSAGVSDMVSPIPRARLTRKHSTPSLCSLADDDVAILNSVYQECFPRAQRIMEDRLRSLIAAEQANPIGVPESMDGAFCFVHDQALQLAADCLRASEQNQLSAAQFANLSSNLGQLAKQAKQKCPLSAQKLHRIIINILMAIARCARLSECLEFSPETLKWDNQLETPGQGIISQVQGDVYRYVTEQLGDLVSAGLSGLDDFSLFNTSARRPNHLTTPKTPGAALLGNEQQPKELTTSLGSIAAPSEDDFEVIKNISNGAYGAVFLVRQKRTGQRFAMKRINKRCLALHNQCEQIWAERNILTFADNPFVVQMYCSFETPKHFCMVMEYVQGGDVASLLKKVRTIPVDLARVYFAEIVLALAYLHSYGIIHRDIKPDNLLITATGHIKLTDFGLSKVGLMNRTTNLYVSDSASGASCTGERLFKDKQVYGTPQYIAPEVILGQDYGKAVDWWSVGVVLYECLLGVTPFYGSTPQEVFHMIVYHDTIEWPDDPDDPLYPTDDSRDLIENLLQNDPEARLGSGPSGAGDVKAHAFFDSIDWQSILWQKSEMLFVPQLDDDEDTGYFDNRSDRYCHDDTAHDNEAMMQAEVFPPPSSCSPYEGNSPLVRSRAGSIVESLRSGQHNESTLLPPSRDATLAAATTPPTNPDLMYQSFCSFSPRYARDSLSLISSSGESSPLLASSLSAADLNSARASIPAHAKRVGSPDSNIESNPASASLTSVASEPSVARTVPVISVNTPANSHILSMAAAQVAQEQRTQPAVRHASKDPIQNSSKPLSLVIPGSSGHQGHQSLGHTSSSPITGPDHRRISGGSDGSTSSLSPLSPRHFAVPAIPAPQSVVIKRGPRGFGFTFRTVRIRETTILPTPNLKTPNRKTRLQHQIVSVQANSPAAAAGLQPGHVIMAVNDGSVDGHSHIDVLTRLVESKGVITVHTCEPDQAQIIRNTPAYMTGNRYRNQRYAARGGPAATPASTMVHRKSFDPAAKSRSNLARHSSMTAEPSPSGESSSSTNGSDIASQVKAPTPTSSRPNSSSGMRPSLSGSQTRLSASFSGSGVRMQRALSQTTLPVPNNVFPQINSNGPSLAANRRVSTCSNTPPPNRPHQLLAMPTTIGAGSLLSASLPQGVLSHALHNPPPPPPPNRPRNMRQLSHQTISNNNGNMQQTTPSSLHPKTAAGSEHSGGTSVSRRRSFHTMPSPLARTPSPLTAASPTAGTNSFLSGQVNVAASLPITPISPQRACSPLVQEPGGSLRTRNISNRRVQSVYVPHPTGSGLNLTTIQGGAAASESSSSTTSLPVSGGGLDFNDSAGSTGSEFMERKSESSVTTPLQPHHLVRRRLTTDDGTWPVGGEDDSEPEKL